MKLFLLIATTVTLGVASSNLDMAKKPMIENVPEHLGTQGQLNDPINVHPLEDPENVKYTLINTTGCDIAANFWMDGFDDTRNDLFPGRITNFLEAQSSDVITVGQIRTVFNAPAGAITITNAAITWQIPGMLNWFSFYPNGPANPQLFLTGLPAPCSCVLVTWDEVARTITFSQGSGC